MCAGEVQANSLNFDHMVKAQTYSIEEEENSSEEDSWEDYYSEDELKALRKDVGFRSILDGGVRHCHTLRCQVAEKNGRLIYYGKPFRRSQWSWQPPKIIRVQGRLAKESSDPRNNHPEISIYNERGELQRLDACPCGGELLMDHNYNLYCVDCSIIYE